MAIGCYSVTTRDDRIAPRQDAEQDATIRLMTDEGLANLLDKQFRAHGSVLDLTTRAAIRSAVRRPASLSNFFMLREAQRI